MMPIQRFINALEEKAHAFRAVQGQDQCIRVGEVLLIRQTTLWDVHRVTLPPLLPPQHVLAIASICYSCQLTSIFVD